jgi:L,D-peptidoglycan transpeptidase YkuD (ErfK/YbiS/YcfS/YnhG family)
VWKQILSSTAYVGKNRHCKTREGDKKTPTGTFNLKAPFGIKSNPGTSLSYLKVTNTTSGAGSPVPNTITS